MFLVLLVWLQAAPLSKTVIVVASLLFILAIALLVYFVRKLRAGSKVDEDWTLSRSSLFVEPPKESIAASPPPTEILATPEPIKATAGETRMLASDRLETESPAAEPSPAVEPEPLPTPEMAAPLSEAPPATGLLASPDPALPARADRRTQLFTSPPPREARATEVLSSRSPEPGREPEKVAADVPTLDITTDITTDPATPFDEEIWAGLNEPTPEAPPSVTDVTRELRSPAAPVSAAPPRADEPPQMARVEQRPPRAPFEPPIVEPLHQTRAPFEPPVINPITPREQTALLGTKPPTPEPTAPLYSTSAPRSERASDIETPPRRAPEPGDPAADRVWDSASVAPAGRAPSTHKPAGAVLGLPLEMSHAPLVLGTPAKSREEIGIGSLTGYGKVDKEGGRGGLIALLLALLIFGGALLAYFFVPSVHDRVNARIARARGLDPNEQNPTQPKARIFPSNVPETDKNTVHAKGSVQNISNETLENLSLEVQLNKSGGEIEMIDVPVTPAQLAPNDQGAYSFDYDGKGVSSYTIKRLSSNGKEARFTAPGQK